jgi:sulfatase maturation enzyme AslB (radical SAM superfamily)
MNEFYSYGSIKEKTFEEIWNDEPIRKLRNDFLAGKKLNRCEGCHKSEAAGQESFRMVANRQYANEFDRLARTAPDGSVASSEVLFLDLRLSNLCNFKCRSCGPQYSVAWNADAEKILGHELPGVVHPTNSPEDFWIMFEKMLPNLRAIYFAGGEPLIEDMHYKLLEKLISAGRTDIALDYNTNFSTLKWKNWDVTKLWSSFKVVTIGASLDGVEQQGELLRKGMNWQKTVENFNRLKGEAPHVSFFVYMTVSVLNAFHLPAAISKFIELGMVRRAQDLQLSVASSPRYINLAMLNLNERANLSKTYSDFVLSLSSQVDKELLAKVKLELRAVEMSLANELWIKEREEFRRYTFALDRLRGERFGTLFPELFNLLYL